MAVLKNKEEARQEKEKEKECPLPKPSMGRCHLTGSGEVKDKQFSSWVSLSLKPNQVLSWWVLLLSLVQPRALWIWCPLVIHRAAL